LTGVQLGLRGKESGSMPDVSKRHLPELDERKIVVLEFVAASTIFLIVALVLYMVFTYRPA
jgi:hypothetical protein